MGGRASRVANKKGERERGRTLNQKVSSRRYDLDWLRVLAVAGVFFYHCGRFFNADDWNIKNATTSPLVEGVLNLFELWGMPLLFLISGASIYLALRPGRARHFLLDRGRRLLVPLALGILVLAPPQVYLDRLTHGEFQGSLLQFLPSYYGDWHRFYGNFDWAGVHLWYLEYLFIFTATLLPLFAALKSPAGRRMMAAVGTFSSRPGAILTWSLPIAAVLGLIDPLGLLRPSPPEHLLRLFIYPIFVVYGFLIIADERVQAAIARRGQRRLSLALALALSLVGPSFMGMLMDHPGPVSYWAGMIAASLLIWSWLLAILGYGLTYLNVNHRVLPYANEAVLPFYILHQPLILLAGYWIIPLPLPIWCMYAIIAVVALGMVLGLYEFGIRRVNAMRRVFGMKARESELPVARAAIRAA
jgi:peptidoglycan/LPS O-acetylase OafA/YrhL